MIFLSLVKPRKYTDHASNTLARRDGVETGGSKLLTPLRTLRFQIPPFFFLSSCHLACKQPLRRQISLHPAAREPRRACSQAILPSTLSSIATSHALLNNFPPFFPLPIPFKLPPPAFPGSNPLSSSSLCHFENVNANIKASLSRWQSALPTKSM